MEVRESKGDGAIANTLVSMYDRLSKLHHYQISRTAIDIVEGPLTAQECSVLECIAQLWEVKYIRRPQSVPLF